MHLVQTLKRRRLANFGRADRQTRGRETEYADQSKVNDPDLDAAKRQLHKADVTSIAILAYLMRQLGDSIELLLRGLPMSCEVR